MILKLWKNRNYSRAGAEAEGTINLDITVTLYKETHFGKGLKVMEELTKEI